MLHDPALSIGFEIIDYNLAQRKNINFRLKINCQISKELTL